MGKLSEAKILGGIGALLMLIGGGIVAGVGAIIGLILIFIAVRYIANETKDNSIFDNYLMHFIFTIIAIVAFVAIFFVSIGGLTFFTGFEDLNPSDPMAVWDYIQPFIVWWVVGGLIAWIFFIISAIYLRKSYNSITEHTGVGFFRTTATIYLIGAVSAIILIGFLIIIVAKIIEIIAFFMLPDKLPASKGS
jgi:uncharacterized membrane protein